MRPLEGRCFFLQLLPTCLLSPSLAKAPLTEVLPSDAPQNSSDQTSVLEVLWREPERASKTLERFFLGIWPPSWMLLPWWSFEGFASL